MQSPTVIDENKQIRWVLLGAVVGVGNFFTIPQELAKVGALAFLFWHLISLIFLCAPLICAELMWGKWLRRPLHNSFEIVHPRFKHLTVIVLLAIGVAFPPYIYAFSTFLVQTALFFVNSLGLTHEYQQIDSYLYLPYVGSLAIAGLAIATLQLRRTSFVRLVKALVLLSFAGAAWVAFEVIRQWGVDAHVHLLQQGFRNTWFRDVMRIANFSFFSVTLCCSIFYTLIQWMPKRRSEEGGLIRTSLFLALGDFVASFLCYLIVAPFITPRDVPTPSAIYLDWIPHSLIYLDGGYLTILTLCATIFAMGYCTVAVVIWVCADQLEAGLGQTRRRTIVRLSWWSVVALFLPIIPKLRQEMAALALHVLMPLSGLIFATFVMWKMPRKSQSLMLGHGFLLDGMVKFWRYSMLFLVIPYIILSFFF
ncbi:MAG TPA: hypothetical protein VM901_11485 [Bdellovibrionota bacterium]|nr:hypothetical protein [Bdellovibrionota bacterium]